MYNEHAAYILLNMFNKKILEHQTVLTDSNDDMYDVSKLPLQDS